MLSYVEGPRYTLEGYIKRILYDAGRPISETELTQNIISCLGAPDSELDEIQVRVHKALTRPNAPFLVENGSWAVNFNLEKNQLNNRAVESLVLASAPQSYGRILEYIGLTTKRSRGDLMSQIDLDGDPRFCRLEDGQWVLTEWVLDPNGYPETASELPFDSLMATPKHKEERIEMSTETELHAITSNEGVKKTLSIADFLNQLFGILNTLEKRQGEIPTEVVKFFEAENLNAIQSLMTERKDLGELHKDLELLLQKYGQPSSLFTL